MNGLTDHKKWMGQRIYPVGHKSLQKSKKKKNVQLYKYGDRSLMESPLTPPLVNNRVRFEMNWISFDDYYCCNFFYVCM